MLPSRVRHLRLGELACLLGNLASLAIACNFLIAHNCHCRHCKASHDSRACMDTPSCTHSHALPVAPGGIQASSRLPCSTPLTPWRQPLLRPPVHLVRPQPPNASAALAFPSPDDQQPAASTSSQQAQEPSRAEQQQQQRAHANQTAAAQAAQAAALKAKRDAQDINSLPPLPAASKGLRLPPTAPMTWTFMITYLLFMLIVPIVALLVRGWQHFSDAPHPHMPLL